MLIKSLLVSLLFSTGFTASANSKIPHVEIRRHQLLIDGVAQPQLFGAELQYFRLRGGYGPNIPRETVIALWNKALDRMVEAKMNAISFYIPWDFHEYAEGKFDFDGTVDQDGDGRADYPSRDLKTFFRLIDEHGIKRIMVRPGPFINAEWGFLGFGAIPSWFHAKYPQSHNQTPQGLNRPLYDYLDPDLARHTKLWFSRLYRDVLKERMGHGKPIAFMQIDNETNYQWDTIYHSDYAPRSVKRYQEFLRARYGSLTKLNQAHARQWAAWSEIRPPLKKNENLGEDQDWYRFTDHVIFRFLKMVRGTWEGLGVREPNVIFTLAESYNASGEGLIPNYVYRNARGETGMMTVNLYPKTYETSDGVLLNTPFKADLDVKAADEANDAYLGSRQEWVLGPEIQGGWWRDTPVSPEARRQTYFTVLGHGMKAIFVYYFNEGQNWGVEWSYQQIKPLFDELRQEWKAENLPMQDLSNEFWAELQTRTERKVLVGLDARHILNLNLQDGETLFFDAPLDASANPRQHFFDLKVFGERVIAPHRNFLGRAVAVTDSVAIVKDSDAHVPSPVAGLDSLVVSAEWTGGALALLMNSSFNPRIVHGDLSRSAAFSESKVLMHLDTGVNANRTVSGIRHALRSGRGVVNFMADDLACRLGVTKARIACAASYESRKPTRIAEGGEEWFTFHIDGAGHLRAPGAKGTKAVSMKAKGVAFTYDLSGMRGCEPVLFWRDQAVGYRCRTAGGAFTQIGAPIFEHYNTNDYGTLADAANRRLFMKALLKSYGVQPHVAMSSEADRVVAFARRDPHHKLLWVTVKTGKREPQTLRLRVTRTLLEDLRTLSRESQGGRRLRVTDVLTGEAKWMSLSDVVSKGFEVKLGADDSRAYTIER